MTGPLRDPPANFLLQSRKITAYLLEPNHVRGGSKARFFLSFGFRIAEADAFGRALLNHAVPENYVETVRGSRGDERLVYEGPIFSPDGRNPSIRTVWLKEENATARFITAVPMT